MSKQKLAKELQGYTRETTNCGNCKHFTSTKETTKYGYVNETNLRCGIGGFAIHKTARCNFHETEEV
jgi:hypothetical protein